MKEGCGTEPKITLKTTPRGPVAHVQVLVISDLHQAAARMASIWSGWGFSLSPASAESSLLSSRKGVGA